MGANDQFADRLVTQTVQVQRFEAGVRQEVLGALKQLETELVTSIQRMDLEGVTRDAYKRARAEKMLEQTRTTIRDGYKALGAGFQEHLVDLSKVQSQAIQRLADQVFTGSVMTTALTPQDLRSIVKNLIVDGNPAAEWWGRQAEGLRLNFAREVRQGLMAAETTQDIIKRIRGKDTGARQVVVIDGEKRILPKFSGGIMDISTRQAAGLVRTAVQAVSNDVLTETYKANSDVLSAVTLIATLDDRTCEECMGLDGGLWDAVTEEPLPDSPVQDRNLPDPPLHINCRCVTGPVTKSWKQLIEEAGSTPPKDLKEATPSTRASMDGQVPARVNYEEWLASKPVSFQKEVLGPGKWQLWNDGKIKSLTQLTDQTGNILTLAQLREKLGAPEPAVASPPIEVEPAVVYGADGRDVRLPPVGTVIQREYGGKIHEVVETDHFTFLYEGVEYKSLAAVAIKIRGFNNRMDAGQWFGLGKNPKTTTPPVPVPEPPKDILPPPSDLSIRSATLRQKRLAELPPEGKGTDNERFERSRLRILETGVSSVSPFRERLTPASAEAAARAFEEMKAKGIRLDDIRVTATAAPENDRRLEEAYAWANMVTGEITINGKTFNQYAARRPAPSSLFRDDWFTDDRPEGVLIHETGHARHGMNLNSDIVTIMGLRSWEPKMAESIGLVWNKRTDKYVWPSGGVPAGSSRYGATNPLEFVAEGFAYLMTGKKMDPKLLALYKKLGGQVP